MKKFKIGLIILVTFMWIPFVKADTTNYIFDITKNNEFGNFNFTNIYQKIENSNFDNYAIVFNITPTGEYLNNYYLYEWNNNEVNFRYLFDIEQSYYGIIDNNSKIYRTVYLNNTSTTTDTINSITLYGYGGYLLYDTNYNFESEYNVEFRGFYQDNIALNIGDKIPKYKDLIQYESWSDYENNYLEGYTEVNLDNYEYVLLTLKDYNQTQAFQTNLQVKGQIGITPIYNYGQTSKDAVTGVQVQDRCNVNYGNYTSYPFYILQTDLQNNVIYAVKECSQGSSFKFDNSVFDVTYITAENEESPTVTINGKTYDVIPYDDLPSTATKNEEDNYIPGESGSATDTGGLDSAIAGAQSKLSEIWNTFTYFTSFIGLIFSSLPSEVHTILLSAFTIMIVLGIIKIFLGK